MLDDLPRREREILEIVLALGEASATDIRRAMTDPPSDSAVRTLLSRLEAKAMVKHREVDQTYFYSSAKQPALLRNSALRQLVDGVFGGSGVEAATALLGQIKGLSAEDAEALQKAIDAAKKRRK